MMMGRGSFELHISHVYMPLFVGRLCFTKAGCVRSDSDKQLLMEEACAPKRQEMSLARVMGERTVRLSVLGPTCFGIYDWLVISIVWVVTLICVYSLPANPSN